VGERVGNEAIRHARKGPKRKAVELAADPVTPAQSNLVVEFVRAAPQVAPSGTPARDV
jgi:hypothetical protein